MASYPFDECIHQCEVLAHGNTEDMCYQNCTLNPGHTDFVPVKEFGMEHLPVHARTKTNMDDLQNCIDRTVRVVTTNTSSHRPDTYPFSESKGSNSMRRCGTGFVEHSWGQAWDPRDMHKYVAMRQGSYIKQYLVKRQKWIKRDRTKPCPCLNCKTVKSSQTDSFYFVISTSTHIIYDEHEAQNATFELFFHSDDRDGVEYLYGVDVVDKCQWMVKTEQCYVICVTHDPLLAKRLNKILDTQWYSEVEDISHVEHVGILISHPHGVSKRISVGNIIERCFIGEYTKSQRFEYNVGTTVCFPDKECKNKNGQQNYLDIFDLETMTRQNETEIFRLNCDATVCTPPGCYIDQRRQINEYKSFRIKFPPGTELITNDGRRYAIQSTEFYNGRGHSSGSDAFFMYYSYNMASCPGSSGARILQQIFNPRDKYENFYQTNHYGLCSHGQNVSGLGQTLFYQK